MTCIGAASLEESLQLAVAAYDEDSVAIEDDDDRFLVRHTLCELNGVEVPFAAQHRTEEPMRGGVINRLRDIKTRSEFGVFAPPPLHLHYFHKLDQSVTKWSPLLHFFSFRAKIEHNRIIAERFESDWNWRGDWGLSRSHFRFSIF